MFKWFSRSREGRRAADVASVEMTEIPTVQFDASSVSKSVKVDLRRNIEALEDVAQGDVGMIYEAALRAVMKGGALNILFDALMTIDGMSRGRAEEITHNLNSKASVLIKNEKSLELGVTDAVWRYSGAPCGTPKQDASHRAADGKRYSIAKGMYIDGAWTHPGYEDGCMCISKPIIPGLS